MVAVILLQSSPSAWSSASSTLAIAIWGSQSAVQCELIAFFTSCDLNTQLIFSWLTWSSCAITKLSMQCAWSMWSKSSSFYNCRCRCIYMYPTHYTCSCLLHSCTNTIYTKLTCNCISGSMQPDIVLVLNIRSSRIYFIHMSPKEQINGFK